MEQVFEGEHLPLLTLKDKMLVNNKYLQRGDILTYPRPELHVSHLSHSTDLKGFCGIRRDGGFRDTRKKDMVWFSLTVSPKDLKEAETRDMILVHPGGREQRIKAQRRAQENIPAEERPLEEATAEQEVRADRKRTCGEPEEEFTPKKKPRTQAGMEKERAEKELLAEIDRKPHAATQDSPGDIPDEETTEEETTEEETVEETPESDFLLKFASSPSFSSRSRYGSFRFTFSLEDVLHEYSQQFCAGQDPVLRVFRTVLYKQEVMYSVLVHSPANQEMFSHYPLLVETPHCICAFRAEPKPHFIWRPQAMCETHRFAVVVSGHNSLRTEKVGHTFYLWDHVTLALHVDRQLLRFTDRDLRESLSFCDRGEVTVPKEGHHPYFQEFEEAEAVVRERWHHHCLQKFNQSNFHIPNFTSA